jgi:soluble cytochrome b562
MADFLDQSDVDDLVREQIRKEQVISARKKLIIMWEEATELALVNRLINSDDIRDYIHNMDRMIHGNDKYRYADSYAAIRRSAKSKGII